MELATFVYQQYISSRGIKKRAWSLIRKALIKLLNDPTCSLPIHGRNLKLPLSHNLPIYLNNFPYYDQLPRRMSKYIYQKQDHLNCIDVGANIGDSIASFCLGDMDTFLAIEPNPKFNKLLAKNWDWNKNIIVVSNICSSSSEENSEFIIQEKNGTASILQGENGLKIDRRTLDEIVSDHPFAKQVNILKIDTDGHDFEVIEGSRKLLSENLPAVLFECYVFDNTNYVEDCIRSLKLFEQIGYEYFLLYNNFGYLMGKYSLSNLSPLKNLLFFQLTSDFYYFDILVMKTEDIVEFYQTEVDFFSDRMSNKLLQRTAIVAANL